MFQDPKLAQDIDSRGTGQLGSRTVTVCSGLDLVNITYTHFVAADEATAKVRANYVTSFLLLVDKIKFVVH